MSSWKGQATALHLRLAMITATRGGLRRHLHAHPFFELALMFEGTCEWQFPRRESVCLKDGDLLLLPPGRRHREWVPVQRRVRQGWVGFETSEEIPPDWLRPISAGALAGEMRRLFRTVHEEHQSSAFGAARRTELALEEILIVFARLHAPPGDEPAPAGSAESRHVAGAAAQTIRANLRQPLSVRELAGYHSLSVSRFSAVFRQVHGVGPGRFLQRERLARARELLRTAGPSIKEVAAECGYADGAHFAHAFTAAEGCSPRAYRSRHRDG